MGIFLLGPFAKPRGAIAAEKSASEGWTKENRGYLGDSKKSHRSFFCLAGGPFSRSVFNPFAGLLGASHKVGNMFFGLSLSKKTASRVADFCEQLIGQRNSQKMSILNVNIFKKY